MKKIFSPNRSVWAYCQGFTAEKGRFTAYLFSLWDLTPKQ